MSGLRQLLIEHGQSMLGPMRPDYVDRVLALAQAPTIDTWEDAHGVLITPTVTVWQAVCRIAPEFSRIGKVTAQDGTVIEEWRAIPDAVTIRRAIAAVVRSSDGGRQ